MRAKYYEISTIVKGYSIEHKALKLGKHSFSFKVGAELFELYDYSEIKGGDCQVDIEMVYSETMMELDVRIAGEVVVECDRCLEDCSIAIDFESPLVVKLCSDAEQMSGEEEGDGEIIWLSNMEPTLDLTQYIYESIILSLPYQRVHAEGECNPDMMQRFNLVTSDEFDEIEQRSQQEQNKSIDKKELSKLEALKAMMEEDR